MNQPLTVQCENCGTLFPAIHEVCPYCGQPQPPAGEPYDDELPPEEELPVEAYDDETIWPEDEIPAGEPYQDEDYPPEEAYDEPDEPDDDIFAVAGEDDTGIDDEDDFYDDEAYADELYAEDEFYDDDDYLDEEIIEERPHRIWPRILLGCMGTLLCVAVFYGGIGVYAAYQGLQERATEIHTEADAHFQRGQEYLANDQVELAVAEFEMALSMNPNLHAAREALREAERIVQSKPTPTSETRLAAAASLLQDAETFITQENWGDAAEKLTQLRDLDPDFQPDHVSGLIYQANYQRGLQLIAPDQINEALKSFETALAERPDDPQAAAQKAKASLYIDGTTALDQENFPTAIELLSQLYEEDNDYLDVPQQLANTYVTLGDAYADQKEWCQAETQYIQALLIRPDDDLQTKSDQSYERCQAAAAAEDATDTAGTQAARPTARSTTSASADQSGATGNPSGPTVAATAIPTATVGTAGGTIYFSMFNPFESRWEIMAVPAGGGAPEAVVTNATMPALSPNGKLLVYHSELIEAEGFHIFDLTTGEDRRITLYKRHILPRWGGDSQQFLFVAQEPGTGRWQVWQGFADGRSDPTILRDGRTADLSSDNETIAYQGTDPQGNDPGIYLVPFGGGEATRLTTHQSDRTPVFSPDSAHVAYMSTRSGNWDIYTISTAGSAPRQITTAPGQDGLPVWSPDGSHLAYVSDADGSWAIYTIPTTGGDAFKVTEWDGNRPDWLLAQIWWGR